MSNFIDLYLVEDEEGEYYEAFSDHTIAEDYVRTANTALRTNSKKLRVRHTIVDIEGD